MARKALILNSKRLLKKQENCAKAGVKMKKSTRVHNRCGVCGRKGGYLRKYGMCRICFRQRAAFGEINGVTKSSW